MRSSARNSGVTSREIQALDPAEEGGIICHLETGDACREFPNKSLHLAVGHLQEGVDAGHPRNERLRILKRPTTLVGVHLGEMVIPPVDKVKREIELTALDQAFILYTPVASIGIRASPAFFSG